MILNKFNMDPCEFFVCMLEAWLSVIKFSRRFDLLVGCLGPGGRIPLLLRLQMTEIGRWTAL